MPRITSVTTRTGDQGDTSSGGGQRISKDSCRIAAYGAVDELNSSIGVAIATGLDPRLASILARIQNELFEVGADLTTPRQSADRSAGPRTTNEYVQRLEDDQAALAEALPPLTNFVLPGGALGAAQLHLARTVCRRAERLVVALRRNEGLHGEALRYLNRLSDLLFIMARYENKQQETPEPVWRSDV